MKEWPRSIAVGANVYRVDYQEVLGDSETDWRGCLRIGQARIIVSTHDTFGKPLRFITRVDTLLHEIIHAVFYAIPLAKDEIVEAHRESFVSTLGVELARALVDAGIITEPQAPEGAEGENR